MGFASFVLGLVGTVLFVSSLGLPWFSTSRLPTECNVAPLHLLSGVLSGDANFGPYVLALQKYLQSASSTAAVYNVYLDQFFSTQTIQPMMRVVSNMKYVEIIVGGTLIVHVAAALVLFSDFGRILALFGVGMIGFVLFYNDILPCYTDPFSGATWAVAGVLILLLATAMSGGARASKKAPAANSKKAGAAAKAKKDQ